MTAEEKTGPYRPINTRTPHFMNIGEIESAFNVKERKRGMRDVKEQVKRIESKYSEFLWRELAKIRDAETVGDYATALKLATSLIVYLSEPTKKKLQEKAEQMQKALLYVGQMKAGTDLFTSGVIRHRRLQLAAGQIFSKFIDAVTAELDKVGHYEKRKLIPRSRFTE